MWWVWEADGGDSAVIYHVAGMERWLLAAFKFSFVCSSWSMTSHKQFLFFYPLFFLNTRTHARAGTNTHIHKFYLTHDGLVCKMQSVFPIRVDERYGIF